MVIYGKRQQAMIPMGGGLALIAISYFASALWMTVLGIILVAAVYYLRRYE
jgi:hypothetical protein